MANDSIYQLIRWMNGVSLSPELRKFVLELGAAANVHDGWLSMPIATTNQKTITIPERRRGTESSLCKR